MTAQNAARIVKALEQFGFGSLGLTQTDFLLPERDQSKSDSACVFASEKSTRNFNEGAHL